MDSQEDACGVETESNCALSALEEVSNSRLNMPVSNVLEKGVNVQCLALLLLPKVYSQEMFLLRG